MKKLTKKAIKCIALILAATLILTTVSMITLPTLADEAVYTDSLDPRNYDSLTHSDGTTAVTLVNAVIAGPGDVGWAVAEANNTSVIVSGTAIYSFDDPIKDIKFTTGFSNNEGFLGSIKFQSSTDGITWNDISTTRTTDGFYWDAGAAHSHVYDVASFEETDSIKYIKVIFNKGFFDGPGLRNIEYSSYVAEVAYDEHVVINNPYTVEDSEGNTDVHLAEASIAGPGVVGYLVAKSDNTFTSGSVVYKFKRAIKNIQFVTGYSNNEGFLGSVKFYASTDGNEWSQVSTKRVTDGFYWDAGAAHSHVYDTATFGDSAKIKYIKVEFTKGFFDGPGLREINYSSYGAEPIAYTDSVALNNYVSLEDENGNKDVSWISASIAGPGDVGFALAKSDNTVVNGSAVYSFMSSLRDVQFVTGYSDNEGFLGSVKFFSSTDGNVWTPITTERTTGGFYWDSGNAHSHVYDTVTFEENSKVKYLKLEFTKGVYDAPGIREIKYTTQLSGENPQIADAPMKDRYEIRKSVDKVAHIQKDGFPLTNVFGVGDNLWYDVYTFWDMEAWKSGSVTDAWKPGVVEYYSEEAITDFRVKGIWHGGTDDIKVYASKDAEEWFLLKPEIAEVGDFSNPNWGAFTSKWAYASLKPESDIHYIRIQTVDRIIWLPFLPGLCFMDYSTVSYDGMPERPDSYVNVSLEENYFDQDEESIIFKSGSTMTDYDLWVKPIDGKTPVISISRDGYNWKPSAAVSEVAEGDILSYYDKMLAEDGYQYIKIEKSTAEFVKLRYNIASGGTDTTRRHYEMPPLSEDIEDLDHDKVHIAISEGKNDGIMEWTDLSPTMNSDQNASFIGGKYGIVGPEGVGSLLISTPNVTDFKLRAAFASAMNFIHIKAYGKSSTTGKETEIPLLRVVAKGFENCGFKNYIFRPADREALKAAKYHYIRIEMTKEITFMDQILDFEYFYELPDLIPMPDFDAPSADEIELKDTFDSVRLTEDEGGMAIDNCYLQREEIAIGVNNPRDVIVRKTYFMAESYLIYKVPALSSFDIRAYKSGDCISDLIISVSEDGENWTEVTASILEREIYDGFKKVAYKASQSDIGEGMNYVKIEIPDLEGSELELMLYELQLLHKSNEIPVEDEEEEIEEDTSVSEDDTNIEEDVEEEEEEESKPARRKKKVIRRRKLNTGLYWWVWLLIAAGAVVVVAAGTITTVVIVVKKRKKAQLK